MVVVAAGAVEPDDVEPGLELSEGVEVSEDEVPAELGADLLSDDDDDAIAGSGLRESVA